MNLKPSDRAMNKILQILSQALAATIIAILLASCHSLVPYKSGATPERLPARCRKPRVLFLMGQPQRREEWMAGNKVIGEKWIYLDYWWVQDSWSNRFGSWTIFFDGNEEFVGWRLDSPLPQQPEVREVYYEPRGKILSPPGSTRPQQEGHQS